MKAGHGLAIWGARLRAIYGDRAGTEFRREIFVRLNIPPSESLLGGVSQPLSGQQVRDLLLKLAGSESVARITRQAVEELQPSRPDVVFLDIGIPGMSGFDLLDGLGDAQPLVVFTTAYDRYALDAFRVNSIDYFLSRWSPHS